MIFLSYSSIPWVKGQMPPLQVHWWSKAGRSGQRAVQPFRRAWRAERDLLKLNKGKCSLLHIKRGCKEDRPRLWLVLPRKGKETIERNWCTGDSTWIWGRTSLLCRWLSNGTGCPETLWSLPHWRFGTWMGATLCHGLWDDPAWAGRLDQMTPCGAFKTYPVCDSEINNFKVLPILINCQRTEHYSCAMIIIKTVSLWITKKFHFNTL